MVHSQISLTPVQFTVDFSASFSRLPSVIIMLKLPKTVLGVVNKLIAVLLDDIIVVFNM